ncbi:hypothetical protein BT96DRAFT_1039956 [Gymnopus androsaceus JB14]|uniref:Cellobiose dehydrogenase cytochrome domain-containing protein n=1 Tax=Gymnopus androsaceus JB14 TaxID=1447944 RepID=A0A6A4HFF6_9AGAR|nr:hypothetical protein BT96DRAFT_1039956 [Gymnopus androsaceus JB14]
MLSSRLLSIICTAFGISMLASHQGVHAIFPNDISIVVPTFQPVYDVTIILVPNITQYFVPGPFGGRAFIGFLGGNLTNSSTGELEAEILPGVGGEFGILSASNGKFYVDVSFALQWTDDQTFAFVKQQGIGSQLRRSNIICHTYRSLHDSRMETNSASRQGIAENVLLLSILILTESSTPDGTIGYGRIFTKTSPDPTISS